MSSTASGLPEFFFPELTPILLLFAWTEPLSRFSCGIGQTKQNTTFNNGSLGSRIDEERSEMR